MIATFSSRVESSWVRIQRVAITAKWQDEQISLLFMLTGIIANHPPALYSPGMPVTSFL